MPWIDTNGIGIHYELVGEGPSVCCSRDGRRVRELGVAVAPALSTGFRTLRCDPPVRRPREGPPSRSRIDLLVADLEALLAGTGLPPPYHFVTVAAAASRGSSTTKYPDRVATYVRIHSSAPIRGGSPCSTTRADSRARRHARGHSVTLDNSWPPDIGDRAAYAAYRGALPRARPGLLRRHQPGGRALQRNASRRGCTGADHGGRRHASTRCARTARASSSPRPSRARATS